MNIADKLRSRFDAEMQNLMSLAGRFADEHKMRVAMVGGAVRDLLLEQPLGDADIILEHPAKPIVSELAKTLKAEMISHERFFTFSLVLPSKKKIDVVTAREETYSAPAKLPDVEPSSVEKDMRRRDFTINAIACWLNRPTFGDLFDPFNGQSDLDKKIIRALHEKSFIDDPTRLFRAARFAARLGFKIDPATESWITACIKSGTPKRLSAVRLRHEFELILKERRPGPALAILQSWKALEIIHPHFGGKDNAGFQPRADSSLVERLVEWLRPFDNAHTQSILADLAFEKQIKVEVLSKLVQSRR